jgi:MFS family permease
VPTAALVASALVVGQLCGNIPAGWAVARIGERTMAIGGGIAIGGVAGLAAPNLRCSRHPSSSSASARPRSASRGTRS